jgi:putative serine/threonine protein kinase
MSFVSISLNELLKCKDDCFLKIICYPIIKNEYFQYRIKKLEELEIEEIIFNKKNNNIIPIGKGCKSIVVLVKRKGEILAAKILRVDSSKENLLHEAEMLKYANKIGIGPLFIAANELIILMEYIKGLEMREWVLNLEESKVELLKNVLKNLLIDCYKLDKAGIDHGELSNAKKHIIIKNNLKPRPIIIDFGKASLNRKPSNVSSIINYLFFSGNLSLKICRMLSISKPPIEIVKKYKKDFSEENFLKILKEIIGEEEIFI